mmetsp:Transcript_10206/g.31495  ORF Transcript_10206/g.31495 Transcript_10206/m.31495 type:complete len:238 (+) Transcript_10206:1539-2252(+)
MRFWRRRLLSPMEQLPLARLQKRCPRPGGHRVNHDVHHFLHVAVHLLALLLDRVALRSLLLQHSEFPAQHGTRSPFILPENFPRLAFEGAKHVVVEVVGELKLQLRTAASLLADRRLCQRSEVVPVTGVAVRRVSGETQGALCAHVVEFHVNTPLGFVGGLNVAHELANAFVVLTNAELLKLLGRFFDSDLVRTERETGEKVNARSQPFVCQRVLVILCHVCTKFDKLGSLTPLNVP